MNEYLTIVIGVVLIYQAVMSFAGNERYIRKLKGKYTPESLATYLKINGVGTLISGVLFILIALNQLDLLKIGPDFNNDKNVLIAYCVALVVLLALVIIARVAILKPLDGAADGKKSNIEDEDY